LLYLAHVIKILPSLGRVLMTQFTW